MTVRFYLKRAKDNRPSGIYACVNYNMDTYKYYLTEKIHPSDWSTKTQRAKIGSVGSFEFNHRLKEISAKITQAFYNYQNTHQGTAPTPSKFKEILDVVLDKQSQARIDREIQKTFWGFLQHFIDRMETGSRVHLQKNTPLSESYIENMRNLMRHLMAYEKLSRRPIEFDTIDMTFYYGFTDYMTKVRKANINTIGKLITAIKVVMREALEFDYHSNMIFTHRKFRSASADTDMVYLTEKEIEEIGALDLSQEPRLDRIRDLFIVGCYTGLRYSDLSKLYSNAIDGSILCVTQAKTGDTVHIPIRTEVRAIIDKYDGHFPEAISNQKFNDALKEICVKCELLQKEVSIKTFTGGQRVTIIKPKYKCVNSHTARRSFATNEYLARDLQPAEIRAITGHKTDKSFYKYIRTTPRENAENVAKKWKEREDRKLRIANPKGQLRAV